MNSEEFLREVLLDGQFYEEFKTKYNKFQEYQSKVTDTLNEFHRVCEKNNVRYQLAYGSLLGAIRDNGQIPWDYDVDVFVPFSEKEALIDALQRDLSDEYYFYCPEVDKKCRHVIMRLAPKEYRTEALHVDVFYLTPVSNDEWERNKEINEIASISKKRYDKLVKYFDEQKSFRGKIRKFINKIKVLNYNADKMYNRYEELCSKHVSDDSKYLVSADSFAADYLFPSNIFDNTKLITTNLGTFRIPVNYDEILSVEYGDYMEIFPLKNRVNEVFNSYDRLSRFALRK